MTDQTDSSPQIEGSSNYTPAEFTVAPEDQHYAQAILSQDVASLPGTFEIGEGVRLPKTVSIDGLPPHLREAARAKLKGVPANRLAEAEAGAIREVLRENSLTIRAKTGFAPSVDPYWSEWADITREANECLSEFDRLNEELSRVASWETIEEPGGEPRAKPVFAASPDRQRAIAARQRELLHRHDLLVSRDGAHGPEGQRRLNKALFDSVERRKAQAEQLEIREEAKALATKKLRDERVEQAAEAIAKSRRPTQ